jgi:hypothetical protein
LEPVSEHKTKYLNRQILTFWRRIPSENKRMMVVVMWLLTLLNWRLPVGQAAPARLRTDTPALVPTGSGLARQPMTSLALIHHLAHRRRL